LLDAVHPVLSSAVPLSVASQLANGVGPGTVVAVVVVVPPPPWPAAGEPVATRKPPRVATATARVPTAPANVCRR